MTTRILLADDSYTVRTHIEKLLTPRFEVCLAHDGLEAIEAIRDQPPDLAILDINMPGMDGYGVCQEVRKMDFDFPIIFLTSVRANAIRILADELGAYLTKPVTDQELFRTISEMLSRCQLSK